MPDVDRERHAKSLNFIFTRVPFAQTVGLQLLDSAEIDVVTVRLPYSADVDNSGRTLHGGAIATLVDTAGSAAAWNGHDYDLGTRGATVSMSVNYVGGSREEAVIATARCVRRGRQLNFAEVEVRTEASDKLVATGSVIYQIQP